ncbi:hypothetical protein GCM10010429_07610 [Micromonospora olivasterospora]
MRAMTVNPSTLVEQADTLCTLHKPGDPLVLPNAWDAGSARAVAAAGFPAVATSSSAVAESLGYADGEATPVDEMLAAVARIARAVPVPVTADLERGYGLRPTELVERLLSAGAVGCNLEDSDPCTRALYDSTSGDRTVRIWDAAPRSRPTCLPPFARRPTRRACRWCSTPGSTYTCAGPATRPGVPPRRSAGPGATGQPGRTPSTRSS